MRSLSEITITGAMAVLAASSVGACGGGSSASTVADDCSPAHSDIETITEGTLSVSVLVTPPYATLDAAGGDLSGVDGEIIKRIAKKECLEVEPTAVEGAALIQSIQSNRADVAIGGIYYTDERAGLIDLSSTMYRDGMATLSKEPGLDTIDSLSGKEIGVIQGYLWNDDLTTVFGAENVTQYPDPAGLISDLGSGRIQVGIFTTAEAGYRASQDSELVVGDVAPDDRVQASTAPGEVVLGSTKGNEALTAAFNEDIAALVQDGGIAAILEEGGMSASLAGDAS